MKDKSSRRNRVICVREREREREGEGEIERSEIRLEALPLWKTTRLCCKIMLKSGLMPNCEISQLKYRG